MVLDKYRGKYKRADLIDYINEIQNLRKPNWYDAAAVSYTHLTLPTKA